MADDPTENAVFPSFLDVADSFVGSGFGQLAADDGKWKCDTCALRWEKSVIQCQACESYQPGLSEEDIAKMEAEKEAQHSETVAKFQTASSVKPTGFSVPSTGTAVSFGTSAAAAPVVFGFSSSQSSSFGFGNAGFSTGTSFGFGSGSVDVGSVSFGFGGSTSSSAPATTASFGFTTFGTVPPEGKKLAELPDFSRNGEVPVGDVFVHGSGECDQLGLGDDTRERRKPTLLKALVGKQICEIAVGAMHVLCVSAGGGLYSWGCNDDGALGRVSSDGSDGGPSDVEPHKVDMHNSVVVRKVSCGDCHSCALDDRGRVWLWGTYKDSNGYIGIVHKRKQEAEVLEKSAEPTLVLEGCSVIASGANHTVALVETPAGKKAVAWGSNATGQLGLPDNVGCGYAEKILSGKVEGLVACSAGGCEVSGESVARLKDANGTERNADKMTLPELQQALAQGASLIVQAPDREVPKAEKKKLLHPQDVCLSAAGVEASNVENIFASAECTFVTVNDGRVLGCGLNGDGQVGLGFASMAVQTLRPVRRLKEASWLGGGLHSTSALANGRVFTWGKAEECGLGLGEKDPPVLEPREVTGLPSIRSLRCGGHHMMATSEDGDVFVWGCGLTHQLGNRPRDVQNPHDIEEDPEDELRPYRVSSKQLEKRFVMLADGGAQHTVELAWDTSYSKLQADDTGSSSLQRADLSSLPADVPQRESDENVESVEPPAKRRLTEAVADADEVMAQPDFTFGFGQLADDGKWKCDTCALRWEKSVIQCQACESYQPGLSEEDIAKMEAEKEAQHSETVAKFQTASSVKPTGFSVPSTGTAVSFGTSAAAAPVVFGFSSSQSSSFGFGNAGFSTGTSFGFGSGSVDVGSVSFGFGGSTSSSAPATTASFGFTTFGTVPPEGKKLAELPDFSRNGEVPVGDVFVHGSGECDQLGLGDDTRERRKPTLLKALVGKQICEIAVGAMHVLCVSAGGGLYSWGCNDDGALGRVSSDGSDGGPSDVEPHKVDMHNSVVVRKVSCGDCHSCALDDRGRVWLWGTYKDSNGYIGIVHKRKQEAEVLEKSAEPTLVLEGCSVIASGANHTVALVETPAGKKAVAWGSNATGQLGLPENVGCGYAEKILSGKVEGLVACSAGGCEVSGESVARLKDANGTERNADKMTLPELQQALAQGASLIVQAPDREVPKAEKKKLLHPQDVCLSAAGVEASNVEGIFASAECTFVTVNDGRVLGCGLNGDGQVGLGFASMAVQTLRPVRRLKEASWLGGGLHSTSALANGRVFTWGKAEECGLGLGEKDPPVLEPREVTGLPSIRSLRCGGLPSLATSEDGDVFVWGCGLTHQLGNRPRDVQNPHDIEEDPEDELRPYRVSSKQLEKRFVMLADGGAQHTVELAWDTSYSKLQADDTGSSSLQRADLSSLPADVPQRESDENVESVEPPAKRRLTEAAALARAEQAEREAEVAKMEAEAAEEAARDVLRCFSGHLLSEVDSSADQLAGEEMEVLWSQSSPSKALSKHSGQPMRPQLSKEMEHWAPQISCLRRGTLEALLLDAAGRDEGLCEAIAAAQCDLKDATPL